MRCSTADLATSFSNHEANGIRFWNAGDEPARILEIISPAGFEQFFDELSDFGGVDKISRETLDELCARYDLEMDVGSVPELCKRFNLKFPGEPIL